MKRQYKDTEDWRNHRYLEEENEETLMMSLVLFSLLMVGALAIMIVLALLML